MRARSNRKSNSNSNSHRSRCHARKLLPFISILCPLPFPFSIPFLLLFLFTLSIIFTVVFAFIRIRIRVLQRRLSTIRVDALSVIQLGDPLRQRAVQVGDQVVRQARPRLLDAEDEVVLARELSTAVKHLAYQPAPNVLHDVQIVGNCGPLLGLQALTIEQLLGGGQSMRHPIVILQHKLCIAAQFADNVGALP